VLLVLAITVFYTPLLPLLPFVSLLGIMCHYSIKKLMLLRVNKIPETMGEDLALGLNAVMPSMILLYALGQYFFIGELSEGGNTWILPILVFTVVFYLIPKGVLLRR